MGALAEMLKIPYLFFRQVAPFAPFNIFFGQPGKHDPVEVFDIITQVFKDAAHNTVTPAVYFNPDLRFVFQVWVSKHIYARRPVFQRYSF